MTNMATKCPKVHLTKNGPCFSKMVLGAWKWGQDDKNLTDKQIEKLVNEAIDIGVTTFDHADIYGHFENEALMGKLLAHAPHLREKMELVSKTGIRMVSHNRPEHKVPSYDTSSQYIVQQAEQSLQNLHTDYLDLLLIHRPDPLMHPDELAEAFQQLHSSGKVRYFGVSNFTPSQFQMLHARFPLVTNQVQVSLLHTECLFDGTLDQALALGFHPMAWSPLGGGSIFAAQPTEAVERIRRVHTAWQEAKGTAMGLDQLLLAWLLKHPAGILPVLGTTKPERIQAAVAATALEMDRQDWFALLRAARGFDIP